MVATGHYYARRTAVGVNERKLNYGGCEVMLSGSYYGEC